uniref:Uncharacterized protein n=1 Tax=Panagrolaimus davidi TaxID=227884 RepID=A0A914QF35_9BILA
MKRDLPFFEHIPPLPLPENGRKVLDFNSKVYENEEDLRLGHKYTHFLLHLFAKNWHNILYYPEKLLNIPHFDPMEYMKKDLEGNCPKQIPKAILKKYERCKFLCKQFQRDDLPFDEWILYLNEIENEEAVFGLFEHRLGWKNGCFDKNLWNLYLKLMKENDQIGYLNIYCRYTRFFIEDKEKVEKYRNEIERISKIPLPVSEFWIDTILYEFDFGTKESALKILKRALAFSNSSVDLKIEDILSPTDYFEVLKKMDPVLIPKIDFFDTLEAPHKSPISCFYPRNQIPTLKKTQNFSIPRTIIYYFTQNIKFNHRMLQKLYNSCKYFFAIQSTPICYRLVLGWKESKYDEQSLFLKIEDFNFFGLNNLYITTTLDILADETQPKLLFNLIKRIYKCEAKYGDIDHQTITINELRHISNGLRDEGDMCPWNSKFIGDDGEERFINNDIWDTKFLEANGGN